MAALGTFDGGEGRDVLRLFFSEDAEGAGMPDVINFRGVTQRLNNDHGLLTGIEEINFGGGSRQDKLVLNVADVMSLLSTSQNHHLLISASETPTSGQNNLFYVYDGGGSINLKDYGFASAPTQTIAEPGVPNAYVYTHMATGYQLIVDSRITNADNLAHA